MIRLASGGSVLEISGITADGAEGFRCAKEGLLSLPTDGVWGSLCFRERFS